MTTGYDCELVRKGLPRQAPQPFPGKSLLGDRFWPSRNADEDVFLGFGILLSWLIAKYCKGDAR